MTTPLDIINLALKKSGVLGVGQSALPEDVNDAYTDMNQMIAQWNRKRWMTYHLDDKSVVSTGALSYSIGPGGDINTARPDRVEAAYYRQIVTTTNNNVDYPLQILESREDYSRITLKNLVSVPQFIFYDAASPLGLLYPYPLMQSGLYELHVIVKSQLAIFTSLTQDITFPPEYEAALMWNLAVRLRPSYQEPPDPSLTAFAIDALNTIRNANAQIPRLVMPGALRRPGLYNVFSDTTY